MITLHSTSNKTVLEAVLEPLATGGDEADRVRRCRDALRGISPTAGAFERTARQFAGRCLDPVQPIVRRLRPTSYTRRFYESDKFFDATAVSSILDSLRTVPEGATRFRAVQVRPAELGRDYHIGCTTRASVVIETTHDGRQEC